MKRAVDARSHYDSANIFARILRGEIPNQTVYEDATILAFHDIAPQAPIHIVAIPRAQYVSMADFSLRASAGEIEGFWRGIGEIIELLDLATDGFRLVSNSGRAAGQEVPHMHVHILAGRLLGPLLCKQGAE